MFDAILEKYGLKYEDLNPEEVQTVNTWINAIQQNQLTLEKVRGYLGAMRATVEEELTKMGHETKQDIFLKARLRNYMLLESLLSTPEKAKEQLDQMLTGIVGTK